MSKAESKGKSVGKIGKKSGGKSGGKGNASDIKPFFVDAKGVPVDIMKPGLQHLVNLDKKKRYERDQLDIYNVLFKKKIEEDGIHPSDL